MKEHFRVFLVLVGVLAALGLAMAGCDLGGDGATSKITGVVRDSVSGDPVAAATVTFGSSSATTGADGSFSLDLGASPGVVIASWSVRGSNYSSVYYEQVPVDASQSTSLTVYLDPIDLSGYTVRQIDLTILAETSVEITDGSSVRGLVMNSNRGYSYFELDYLNPGTNTVYTAAFGSDCLIAVEVDTGIVDFVAMARQVDLSSASSSQTITGTAGTPVWVTPYTPDTYGMLALQTPYGALQVWDDVVPSSPTRVTIYNPYGYEGLWAQMAIDTLPADSDKMYVSTSAIGPIGSSVTLPAINLALGPTGGYPVGYNISYSEPTLSYGTVSGATTYLIWIYEPTPGPEDDILLATIFTPSTSVVLPSWLAAELSGKTLNVTVTAIDVAMAVNLAYLGRSRDWPPELQEAFALVNGGMGPEEGYEQTIVF